MDIKDALITSGITSSLFILYKTIQHYRLHSTCNQNNQLVLEIVSTEPVHTQHENGGLRSLPVEIKEQV